MAVTVSPALLAALFAGYRAEYQKALAAAAQLTQWNKVATLVPSTTGENMYPWLGQFPGLREWVGARVLKNMAAHGYAIKNRKYEGSVTVGREQVEDDQAGVFLPMFNEMGRASAYHPESLVFELLKAGTTSVCYDGQNFFDTEHPVYENADGTGAVTNVSNLDVPGANPGPMWFLLDTSRAIKPLIFQERTKPELTSKTDPNNSDHVFTHDEYVHGVRYRCNAGFGLWQMAHASRQVLNADNYGKARAAMQSIVADGGRPLKVKPTLLVVPPQLEAVGRKLLAKDENGGNEWAGTAELFVCDELV